MLSVSPRFEFDPYDYLIERKSAERGWQGGLNLEACGNLPYAHATIRLGQKEFMLCHQ